LEKLAQTGREKKMMEKFYELGGPVEKMAEASPYWSINCVFWNKKDGEI